MARKKKADRYTFRAIGETNKGVKWDLTAAVSGGSYEQALQAAKVEFSRPCGEQKFRVVSGSEEGW